MRIVTSGAIDAAVTEPLLSRRPNATAVPAAAPAAASSDGGGSAASRAAAPPASSLHFRHHFRTLLLLLRPYPALALALIAVGEALVVAEVGKVAGSFYRIVIDGQPASLAAMLVHAAALYAASTALYAAACWVTGTLALRWRQRLTSHLHQRYCSGHAFYTLQQHQARVAGRQAEAGQPDAGQRLAQESAAAAGGQPQLPLAAWQHQRVDQQPRTDKEQQRQRQQSQGAADNPDQRIAADAAALCDDLAEVAKVAAAAPFKLLYYRREPWLTWGYLGWRGLATVYAFFWAAALVQRLAVAPVSRLVFRQERREGDLRFAHLRLREYAAEVAQYRSAPAERRQLDALLAAVLANQRRLVLVRTVLAACTRAVDYAGAMLNYVVVGAAVFAGMAGNDGGETAQFVSNASFATLALIYTVTELLDLSDRMSRLGGLTARVGELLDTLPPGDHVTGGSKGHDSTIPGGCSGGSAQAASSRTGFGDLHSVRLSIDGRELQPSHFASMLEPPRMLSCLRGSVALEASVHLLGPDLQHEARAIFPDAPAEGQLLACLTFQFAAGGVSLAPDSSGATLERAAAEMDRMLDAFLRWECAVGSALRAAGHWCDSIDPRTGLALRGTQGGRWSEVAAAHALLGYERRDAGICPVVLHPLHGSSAYPATLFTDAPPGVLAAALAGVANASAAPPAGGGSIYNGSAAPLLCMRGLSVRTPAGRLAVAGLNLELQAGQHLLISGLNGCGKSTLVRALCGLHPIEAGSQYLAHTGSNATQPCGCASGGAMVVPQRPLAAPAGGLWQQICYPGGSGESKSTESSGSSSRPPDAELHALLRRVGLEHLLDRVGGSFTAAADWAAMLSPGELQRLSVARVLHRRPALAVLDEVTSAVSEAAAVQLYRELHSEGITCVSIGQDCLHLRRLHPLQLRLSAGPEEGSWQLDAGPLDV
ncbi:hypothetical protein ABPG75_000648 [Micractinium tetrahymenae]